MPKDGTASSQEKPAYAALGFNTTTSLSRSPDPAPGPRIPRKSNYARHLRAPAHGEASNKTGQGASSTKQTHETRVESAVSPTAALPSPSTNPGPPKGATSPYTAVDSPQLRQTTANYNSNLTDIKPDSHFIPPTRSISTSVVSNPAAHGQSRFEYAKLSSPNSDNDESPDNYCESLDRPFSARETKPRDERHAIPPGLSDRPLTIDPRARDQNGRTRSDVLPGSAAAKKGKPLHYNPFTSNEVYIQKHKRLEAMYFGSELKIPWMGKGDPARGQTLRKHPCFNYYKVDKGKMVGSGQYGSVFYGHSPTGQEIALKKIEWDYAQDFARHGFPLTAVREIKILKLTKHPNVVQLLDVVTSKPENGHQHQCKPFEIWMVLERAQHDLSGIIHAMQKEKLKRFSEAEFKSVCKQILEGTHYLHTTPKIKILHRDFKPSNILLTTDGQVKICDFGLARRYKSSKSKPQGLTNEGRVISRWYRSPEVLLGSKRYGPAVDIWSIGCIFVEMLRLKAAFPAQTEIHQLHHIVSICGSWNDDNWPDWQKHTNGQKNVPKPKHQDRRVRAQFATYLDKQSWVIRGDAQKHPLLEVLDKALILDPSKRAKAAQLLKLHYFRIAPPPKPPQFKKGDDHHEYRYDKRPGMKPFVDRLWKDRVRKMKLPQKVQYLEKEKERLSPKQIDFIQKGIEAEKSRTNDRKPKPMIKTEIKNQFEAQFGGAKPKGAAGARRRKPHGNRPNHASQMRQPMNTAPRQARRDPRGQPGQDAFARPQPRTGRRPRQRPRAPNACFNPDDTGPNQARPPRQHQARPPRHHPPHPPHGYPVQGNRRPTKAPQRAAQYGRGDMDPRHARQSSPMDPRHARQSSPPGHRNGPRDYQQPYGPAAHGSRHNVGAPYSTNRRPHQPDHRNHWRSVAPRPRQASANNAPRPRRAEPNHGQNHQRNPPGSSREGYDRRDSGRRRRGHGQGGYSHGNPSRPPIQHQEEQQLDYGLGGGY